MRPCTATYSLLVCILVSYLPFRVHGQTVLAASSVHSANTQNSLTRLAASVALDTLVPPPDIEESRETSIEERRRLRREAYRAARSANPASSADTLPNNSGTEPPRELTVKERRELRRAAYRAKHGLSTASTPRDFVRGGEPNWAFYSQPTSLFQLDFPHLRFVAERSSPRGIHPTIMLGVHTTPRNNTDFGRNFGRARFGLRGLSGGTSMKYYLSDKSSRSPMYLSIGLNGGLAMLEHGLWAREEFQARVLRFNRVESRAYYWEIEAQHGFQYRTSAGFLLDLSYGLAAGIKYLDTDLANNAAEPNGEPMLVSPFWSEDVPLPYARLLLRVGIGYGKWSAPQ